MHIQRLASFSTGHTGGNPAGVVLLDALPAANVMQKVAAEVGYSETVFAAPQGAGVRARYFAPQAEVPFCGHATIALGAALGQVHGAGEFALALNDATIPVSAYEDDGLWGARLTSPPTRFDPIDDDAFTETLALFGWDVSDLDPMIAPAFVNGGANHIVIALRDHHALQNMAYDFDEGAALMLSLGIVTYNLVWRQDAGTLYCRNPFAGHGVYEDPATGAAAAALAGYLRDKYQQTDPYKVLQGQDMEVPSVLNVAAQSGPNAPVQVSGTVRPLKD